MKNIYLFSTLVVLSASLMHAQDNNFNKALEHLKKVKEKIDPSYLLYFEKNSFNDTLVNLLNRLEKSPSRVSVFDAQNQLAKDEEQLIFQLRESHQGTLIDQQLAKENCRNEHFELWKRLLLAQPNFTQSEYAIMTTNSYNTCRRALNGIEREESRRYEIREGLKIRRKIRKALVNLSIQSELPSR